MGGAGNRVPRDPTAHAQERWPSPGPAGQRPQAVASSLAGSKGALCAAFSSLAAGTTVAFAELLGYLKKGFGPGSVTAPRGK